MNYEELLTEASQNGIGIIDYDFISTNIKGLYCDGTVALSRAATETEKSCVLAEELGHHYTSSGIIIDQTSTSNRKQERRARIWAYKKAFLIDDLIQAFKAGCRNRYEIAEYLEITEAFLQEAIDYYKEKYGPYIIQEPYVIYLDPLGVLEMI